MGRIRGDLLERSFSFAVSTLALAAAIPQNAAGRHLQRQLIRSGTSIGANLREADQAYSATDFSYKCSIARKEAAETLYWIQLAEASSLIASKQARSLATEADELTRILASLVRRTQRHLRRTA